MSAVNPQKGHYERIHDAYEAHYYDRTSLWYRDREIYRPLFSTVDLSGARVADIACGSGYNSAALKRYFPSARTEGFDISEAACATYRTLAGPAHQVDLTRPLATGHETFDAAIVIGGLHHCVADLPRTLGNIAALLRTGGLLLMMEPNAEYFLEGVRRFWYRRDGYFDADTERALRHDEISALAAGDFEPVMVRYFGGPAFFCIFNSLVLRIPLGLKPWIAPPLMGAEFVYNRLPGRWLFPSFLAVWRRR